MNRILFVFVVIFFMAGVVRAEESAPAQPMVRAALDVGSGSTKLKVAKVDPVNHRVIQVLYEEAIRVPYQKHLEIAKDKNFDHEVQVLGLKAVEQLKAKAVEFGAMKVEAVATAAFRTAHNGKEFAKEMEKKTGVTFHVIDQKEEGMLAFMAAVAKSGYKEQDLVVWDIGGGSFQLTTLDGSGQFVIEKGQFASVPFKNHIIQVVQGKEIGHHASPNPMRGADMNAALAKAKQVAAQTDPFIREKIIKPGVHVLAVGDLFQYGIKGLLHGGNVLKQQDLVKAINEMKNKDDQELGGDYSDVRISNALLVLGFMQDLKIDSVEIIEVNNADGALAMPSYWQ